MDYTSAFVAKLPRGNGWRGIVNYKHDGVWKKKQKSFRNAKNKTEAKRMLESWKRELDGAVEESTEDVMAYAMRFIDYKLALKSIQPSSATDYKKSLRGWHPYLQGLALSEVTRKHIEDALIEMLQELSSNTVLKRYVALNMVFSYAVDRKELASNPMDGIPRPKQELSTPNALSTEELERVKTRLQSMKPAPWIVGTSLCLYAGLRAEEACGLKVSDIDLEMGRGWIRRAVGYGVGGSYIAPPKNGKPRDFPICEQLRAILEPWLDVSEECFLLSQSTNPMGTRFIGRRWSMLCELEGIQGQAGRKPTLHDLRHTFATMCVKEGMDIKTLQSILGHSSASITLDIYASPDAGAKAAASSIIDRAI